MSSIKLLWETVWSVYKMFNHSLTVWFSIWFILNAATKPVSNTITPSRTSVTTESSAVGTFTIQQQQLLAKKRSAQVLGTDADSISNLKKRNLNSRIFRLKQIKENHADHVAEIYFLQTGGNMMDYQTWRRKAMTSDYANFIKQYRLEPNTVDTASASITTTTLSTATASPTTQTVAQQSHAQNTTQTQPPPLISTNSPHGKQNILIVLLSSSCDFFLFVFLSLSLSLTIHHFRKYLLVSVFVSLSI